ncbi:MAG: sigma-70 family RNA polymerase sigma factor [Planctomycetes bacterium]|nr:sigma-70 family RNA polymerase sigma factor [Planctomycetota bacterium]
MSAPDPQFRSRNKSQYQLACRVSGEELGRTPGPSAEQRDLELIQAALGGDLAAFESLVARYERKAFWIAFHVLGRVEESRDVVQEAFVRVYRSLDRFDFSRNFYTWLYRIVTNLAIDQLRKIRTDRSVQIEGFGDEIVGDDIDRPEDNLEDQELRSDVRRVLADVPARFRTVLALRDLHGISCREIAPILGLTHATVRWRLHKARQLFRERWERASRQSKHPRELGDVGGES